MSDPLIAALYGGVTAAVISGAFNWRLTAGTKRNNYYGVLLKLMTDHNWNCLKEHLGAGLPITFVDEGVAFVCYQHINLLLYAWLHRGVIRRDGTLEGWKRWASAIVEGAKRPENLSYGYAYRDILIHGDLYPADFILWLKNSLELSADRFTPPQVQGAKPQATPPAS